MNHDPRTALLASVSAFAGLDADSLHSLALELVELSLADGDVLLRQGESGDALFIVTAGELDVSVSNGQGRSVLVDRLRAGSVIGEMALLAGSRRTATVSAHGAADVVRISKAGFDRLAESRPGLREQVVAAITPRLERVQLGAVLEAWFGAGQDGQEAVRELQEAGEWLRLSVGDTLYRPGDPATGMYVVVSGRLQVVPVDDEGIGGYQVARGESVGELGVLGGALREEEVVAVRDSHLLHLPAAVVERNPRVIRHIAKVALGRLGAGHLGADRLRRRQGSGLRTIALLPAHPGAPLREVGALLHEQMGDYGRSRLLDAAAVGSAFGGGVPAAGSPLDAALTHWLNELEAEHEHMLLMADDGADDGVVGADAAGSDWTLRCLRQADAVLLVADGGTKPTPGMAMVAGGPDRPGPAVQLVLLHPPGTVQPSGTAAWLEAFGVEASRQLTIHHLRSGDGFGVARMARRLSGRAVGLVLSGGGARGYVHVGLLRAMEELGIEVDLVVGTSMGALVAGGYALTGSHVACEKFTVAFGDKKKLIDRTLPLVALTRSRGVTQTFKEIFGDTRIEDLWMPFQCVSANLSRALPVVHRSGPMWEAVRASTAIPGVFTPLVKDGELLVDGAVMNALPVDLMRDEVGSGTVIGSSTLKRSPPKLGYDFGPSVSGWEVLAQSLRPRSSRKRFPTMIKMLMDATSLSSKHQSVGAKAVADLIVEFPVEDVGNLEFDRHAELVELGYRYGMQALQAWLKEGHGVAPAGGDRGSEAA